MNISVPIRREKARLVIEPSGNGPPDTVNAQELRDATFSEEEIDITRAGPSLGAGPPGKGSRRRKCRSATRSVKSASNSRTRLVPPDREQVGAAQRGAAPSAHPLLLLRDSRSTPPAGRGTGHSCERDLTNGSLGVLLAAGIYIGGGVVVLVLIVILVLLLMRGA